MLTQIDNMTQNKHDLGHLLLKIKRVKKNHADAKLYVIRHLKRP